MKFWRRWIVVVVPVVVAVPTAFRMHCGIGRGGVWLHVGSLLHSYFNIIKTSKSISHPFHILNFPTQDKTSSISISISNRTAIGFSQTWLTLTPHLTKPHQTSPNRLDQIHTRLMLCNQSKKETGINIISYHIHIISILSTNQSRIHSFLSPYPSIHLSLHVIPIPFPSIPYHSSFALPQYPRPKRRPRNRLWKCFVTT